MTQAITTEWLKSVGGHVVHRPRGVSRAFDARGQLVALRYYDTWESAFEGDGKPIYRVKAISQPKGQ